MKYIKKLILLTTLALLLTPDILQGSENCSSTENPVSGYLLTIDHKDIKSAVVVEETKTYTIVKIEKHDGTTIWNVLIAIASEFAPPAAYKACHYFGGNEKTCETAKFITQKVADIGPGRIAKAGQRGFRWVAKTFNRWRKGGKEEVPGFMDESEERQNSRYAEISIETFSQSDASDMGKTMENIGYYHNIPYSKLSVTTKAYIYDYCTCQYVEYDYEEENNTYSVYEEVVVDNDCSEGYDVLVHFKNLRGVWETKAWFHIDGYENTSLNGIKTTEDYIYVHAVNENYYFGSGDKTIYYNGSYLKLTKIDIDPYTDEFEINMCN